MMQEGWLVISRWWRGSENNSWNNFPTNNQTLHLVLGNDDEANYWIDLRLRIATLAITAVCHSVSQSITLCDIIFMLYILWLDLILYIILNIFNMVGFNSVQNSGKWLDYSVKNNLKKLLFATRVFLILLAFKEKVIKTKSKMLRSIWPEKSVMITGSRVWEIFLKVSYEGCKGRFFSRWCKGLAILLNKMKNWLLFLLGSGGISKT